MNGMIEGFDARRLPGDGIEIDALVGGSGPPLLLLHGYPQTRMIWAAVAPRLAQSFTLVIPDLRGYGRSDKPQGDKDHFLYSKRQMARDQIATMKALGHERFHVAGHDRGGRVAYRLALDHPQAVDRLAVIDIVPTAEMWQAGAVGMMGLFQWTFLAQDVPLPEMLLQDRAVDFMQWLFTRWTTPGFEFHPDAMRDYLESGSSPEAIHASCEDYRAGWHVDRLHDEEDRGRKSIAAPTLLLWGEHGAAAKAAPLEIWKQWASHVTGMALPAGHFVPEEAPAETAQALLDFFS